MDVKPKSNKLKRLERKRKLEEQAARRVREDTKAVAAARTLLADRFPLPGLKSPFRGPSQLLRVIVEGQDVPLAPASDLHGLARLFASTDLGKPLSGCPLTPDIEALGHL